MKKIGLLIIILIYSTFLLSQESNDVKLVEFIPSECLDEPSTYLIQKRIISKEFAGDTLIIEIATWENCCWAEIGEIKLIKDTLKLNSHGTYYPEINENGDTVDWYGEICDCDCCFQFIYKIKGLDESKDYVFKLDNEIIELKENKYIIPEFILHNGDSLIKNDSEGYYYSYQFYDSGIIKVVTKRKGGYRLMKSFYENGQLNYQSEMFGDFDNMIYYKYNEEGELIEHENTMEE